MASSKKIENSNTKQNIFWKDISECPQAVLDYIGEIPSLSFTLPDEMLALKSLIKKDTLSTHTFEAFRTSSKQRQIITLNRTNHFAKAILPIRNKDSDDYIGAIVLWVQIDAATKELLLSSEAKALVEHTNQKNTYGLIANNVTTPAGALGLFSLANLRFVESLNSFVITSLFEETSPFPGLSRLFDNRLGLEEPLETISRLINASNQALPEFEEAILELDFIKAEELLYQNKIYWHFNPRAEYAIGKLFEKVGNLPEAQKHYHRAQTLNFPGAFDIELSILSQITKPFRDEYAHVFHAIQRGDRFSVLTTMRQAAHFHPLEGNAILAFCLRQSGENKEGLEACDKSLTLNQLQPDVLAHKWSFLTELKRDDDALDVALKHLRLYPQDITATINLMDSLVLKGSYKRAKLIAKKYLITATNLQLGLKHIHKVHSQTGEWKELLHYYSSLLPHISGPTAELLSQYAEVLIECGLINEAIESCQYALSVEPDNADVILNYARALAISGDEVQAEKLLSAALTSQIQNLNIRDKAFLISLLAEIRRRTGRLDAALETFSSLDGEILEISKQVGSRPAIELVEILIEKGNFTKAKKLIHDVCKLFPEDAIAHAINDQFKNA